MDSSVALAIIAVTSAVITGTASPMLLAWLTNRTRRDEKREDYDRQDLVAKNAADAAQLLLERQQAQADKAEEMAKALLETTKTVEVQSKASNIKLDVIHTLTNSQMTAAIQSELDSTNRELVLMLEMIELKKSMGVQPGAEVMAAAEQTRVKIAELKVSLKTRLDSANQVIEQLGASKSGIQTLNISPTIHIIPAVPTPPGSAMEASEIAGKAYDEKTNPPPKSP